jgi:hypothetical protein
MFADAKPAVLWRRSDFRFESGLAPTWHTIPRKSGKHTLSLSMEMFGDPGNQAGGEINQHSHTMKRILLITTCLAAALATGCKPAEKESTVETTVTKQMDKAQAATKEATEQIKDYTFAQKSEFVAQMKVQIAELNKSLDELSTKIAGSTDAVKAEAEPKVKALREQSTKLTKQLASVTTATPSTWDGIKADSEKAYGSLKDGFSQASDWVAEKIKS